MAIKRRKQLRFRAYYMMMATILLVPFVGFTSAFLANPKISALDSIPSDQFQINKRQHLFQRRHSTHKAVGRHHIIKIVVLKSSSSDATTTTRKVASFYPIPIEEVDWGRLATDASLNSTLAAAANPYKSQFLFPNDDNDKAFQEYCANLQNPKTGIALDPFWEQIKDEATQAVYNEPEAGPQLYQGILSQPSLLRALVTVVANEIATELIPGTLLKILFLESLTPEDEFAIRLDLQAVATRCRSIDTGISALLFHNGFHALVCYRVAHRLWQAGRTSLAYYMQSTVSRKYAADLHPACKLGYGLYLSVGVGVVVGETAVVGNDVSILEGVTLGGTGKESGNRHPKVGNGIVIQHGGTVLGNIPVGDGAIITAKAIVTKPVPPLAIVAGVPAKVVGYQMLVEEDFSDNLQAHLVQKYFPLWRELYENDNTT